MHTTLLWIGNIPFLELCKHGSNLPLNTCMPKRLETDRAHNYSKHYRLTAWFCHHTLTAWLCHHTLTAWLCHPTIKTGLCHPTSTGWPHYLVCRNSIWVPLSRLLVKHIHIFLLLQTYTMSRVKQEFEQVIWSYGQRCSVLIWLMVAGCAGVFFFLAKGSCTS